MIRKVARKAKRVFRKLTKPKVLKKMETCGQNEPRFPAVEALGSVLAFSGSDKQIIEQIEQKKDTVFNGFLPQHRILIKINLNTADAYPASTDPNFLNAIVDILISMGIKNITVGDCSSISALPTKKVFKKTGIKNILKNKAQLICFDEQEWTQVPVNGEYLKKAIVPKAIYNADRIIYLANLKTHDCAEFSMGLKQNVGFIHPLQRYDIHKEFLQEKIAEISLAIRPDLVIIDARKLFITHGPVFGDIANGDTVFAGSDLLSVDLEGYKLLYELKEKNNCLFEFSKDPFKMRQFKHAKKIFERGRST